MVPVLETRYAQSLDLKFMFANRRNQVVIVVNIWVSRHTAKTLFKCLVLLNSETTIIATLDPCHARQKSKYLHPVQNITQKGLVQW